MLAWIRPKFSHSSLYRYLRQASLSRPPFGPKSSSLGTEQNPRPHQGAIEFPLRLPSPQDRSKVACRVTRTHASVYIASCIGFISRCVFEGGMHMHMFLACSQPNPTKPQEPRQRHER